MARSSSGETKKVKLFDFLGDISYGKQYLLKPDTESEYVPFMINRGLAQHLDTILLAGEMNKMPHLSKRMHHDFLFYSVDPRKRYGKWVKADTTNEEEIAAVQKMFGCNREIALQYLTVLSKDEVERMKEHFNDGGVSKQ